MKISNKYKIFISHSYNDKNIAQILIKFFISVGINRDTIFCSSSPGNDVKQIISTEVKNAIKDSCINIAILSNSYYKSVYCLNESGIFWFRDDVPTIPIGVSEFKIDNMLGFINNDYKLRRLDNIDDISYIYDTICKYTNSIQVQPSIFNSQFEELSNNYKNIIQTCNIDEPVYNEIIFEEMIDDEKIILYYIVSKKIIKVKKDELKNWLRDMEIHNVNIDNAFELFKNRGNGNIVNDTLELSLDIFDKCLQNEKIKDDYLLSIIQERTILSANNFKKYWNEDSFDDEEKLFIAYIVDKKNYIFGDCWKAKNQIEDIRRWEKKYNLWDTLSSNYQKCLNSFIINKFVYESDFTEYGNPREYTLYNSLIELFSNNNEFIEELDSIKEKYYLDLPF